MARNRRRRREPNLGENAPPPEQMRDAAMDRPTMAYRRVPPIDVMKADGRLNEAQHKALSVYASVYATAARSVVRSCCDTTVRTGGHGPSRAVLSARSDLAWYDRELGALQPIVEAVVGLDTSLSRFVMDNGGGKDGADGRCRPCHRRMATAMLELRYAAGMIAAAIDAQRGLR